VRRTFWIFAVGFILVMGVSSAQADTSTPTFSCITCEYLPTAPDVTFPSPSIQETWANNITDFIGLAAGDTPTDTYTWSNSLSPDGSSPELADYFLTITDVTTGDNGSAIGMIGIGDPFFMGFSDGGTLTFSSSSGSGSGGSNPTPEPSSIGLLLAGIGTLLALRKFWS
jgi:hypothetical protein